MARVIYFDCFSGISGDMILGALCDAGLDVAELRALLQTLQVPGWSIDAVRETRGWLTGTRMHVHAPEQTTHRHLHDVTAIITQSGLPATVKATALRIFANLADAEAHIHGVRADEVHFHEVGALDAIVDIVGIAAGLHLLGVTQVYASPLPLGSGWVKAAHGDIPVPAPATLHLLTQAHAPIVPDDAGFELVTPTGAAVLATLAIFKRPALALQQVGYGFGKKITPRPNALRVWVGEGVASEGALVLLECNIDDQPAEQLAYVCTQALALGARDVWQQQIVMKKGRAALLLSVLCDRDHEDALVDLLMRQTSTLGMRRSMVDRHVAERALVTVDTHYGPLRVKVKTWRGDVIGAAPEYEDCAAAAQTHAVPLTQVYAAALAAYGAQAGD
ncbi:MAG: nickel pincer cofactor biosynthesis protein LarC [Chloroflexi bacterium]|nr:MAG: nickel pincer cofactor biosynthesis protein LarC [Chloroflexota bacterium]RLT32883.1 MAG: nickel pincer cofactor biosynthesis protein LarC [Chloroflexota bacterium]